MSTYTLQTHDIKYQRVVNLTTPNKMEYVSRYGYIPFIYHTPPSDEHAGFLRMADLRNLCIDNLGKLDWLFWIDTDAIITNQTIPLTRFIDDDYDLVIGEDWNGINVGVFFLKISNDIITFLDSVLSFKSSQEDQEQFTEWWWGSEQHAIYRLMNTIKTKVEHHSLFNGYVMDPILKGKEAQNRHDFVPGSMHNDWRGYVPGPLNPGTWQSRKFQDGDFVLHAAGGNVPYKLDILRQGLQRVIK